jgi:hypothetical protein
MVNYQVSNELITHYSLNYFLLLALRLRQACNESINYPDHKLIIH